MTNPFQPHRTHPLALACPEEAGRSHISDLEELDTIGFVEWDMKSDRLTWDRGAAERFGVPEGSMSSFEGWARFVHPEDVARIRASAAQVAALALDRMTYRYRYRPRGGNWRLVEGVALCWYNDEGELVRMTGVALDITRSDANRRALAISEARMRAILETAPDAILLVDAGGIIHGINGSAESMFGLAASDAIGTAITVFIPAATGLFGAPLPPEVQARSGAGPAHVQTHGFSAQRADGTAFPIELRISETVQGKDRMFTCFVRDISDQIEADQRLHALRAEYFRMSRLNTMGTVAAGLAHELNQPLAAGANFLAAARLLLASEASPEKLDELLQQANSQIVLAGDIIRRLRGFVAPGDHHSERLKIAQLVDEAVALALAGRDRLEMHVDVTHAADLPDILADRVQTLQVLVNLFRNAYYAMAGMTSRSISVDAIQQGNFVEISVIDNGPGFDAPLLGRIETDFASTKPANGMGIGLLICRRIVESWGGQITVQNAAGRGGHVRFTVPIATDAA
jgi:two-component system sensor kinase FixL